ncbi:hypothetical protein LXM94_22010 [Rhizobium sp. TRM95111]|uniref:hypothetical protein n=1 Tax=Rhizobium alarense TaxID=2846851 RepID=UPI001F333D29|nr:hypothetical protein [Rhizobium alarense]MCF3642650.1 hypothetical protein [Rhizobium alarense]
MSDKVDNEAGRPDLIRNYRPVAIRSVVAAHAMIPKHRPDTHSEPSVSDMGFALPAGFHLPPED